LREGCLVSSVESSQLLIDLGCTALQAKIYLTLLALEKATVKTLAKQANVARAEVYRILNELQGKKLVQKIIAAPTEFKAIPLPECLEYLVTCKREEALRLQSEAAKLIKNFKEEKTALAEEPRFLVVNGKKQYLQLFANLISEAEKSIDVMTTLERFAVLQCFLEKYLLERLENGVKVRFILENIENKQALKEHQKLMVESPLVSFRYARASHHVPIIIFDGKKAAIAMSLERKPFESPSLFSTSPTIIHALKSCYDAMWEKAEK
jgi:sugar-specific transcriptional regulator TrmB